MNILGLSILTKMGCLCSREHISINGRKYNVRKQLGTGGFGTVELVEDIHSYKLYALKKLACHSTLDQKAALAEVDYMRQLAHPNIIECVDSSIVERGESASGPISEVLILLPYYERGTLAYELERRQQGGSHFSEALALSMFRQICEAISAMHHATPVPLAHRDIKTANILLAHDYSPIVMDLGSAAPARVQVCGSSDACRLQDEAAERSCMPYRAPELFQVESYCSVDERTDIWSLGCVLFAMCFYKSPFDAVYERGDSVALAVISGNIPIPENSTYSEGLHELILSMMRVAPGERPFIDEVLDKTKSLLARAENRA